MIKADNHPIKNTENYILQTGRMVGIYVFS